MIGGRLPPPRDLDDLICRRCAGPRRPHTRPPAHRRWHRTHAAGRPALIRRASAADGPAGNGRRRSRAGAAPPAAPPRTGAAERAGARPVAPSSLPVLPRHRIASTPRARSGPVMRTPGGQERRQPAAPTAGAVGQAAMDQHVGMEREPPCLERGRHRRDARLGLRRLDVADRPGARRLHAASPGSRRRFWP